MAKLAELLAELRALPSRTIANVAAGHVVLLAGTLWSDLHYVALQVLLAVELLVFNLATTMFYPQRGLRKHAWDLLKMTGGLAFVLFFLIVTYGVVAEGDSGNALMAGISGLGQITGVAATWTFFYIAVRLGLALWQAHAAPDPRRVWTQNVLSENAATFIAMFFMVFVAIFIGAPLMIGMTLIGLDVSAGALLAALMVAVRFCLALVVATMPAQEMQAIAAEPYLD